MIPLEAAKRAGNASNTALTGDIYTRRWATKKGKTVTEHELRVNPVSLAIGAAGVAFTGLLAAGALWLTQRKVGIEQGDDMTLIIDYHASTGDTPGYHLVKTQRGVHIKRIASESIAPNAPLTQYQQTQGYSFVGQTRMMSFPWGQRYWWKYHSGKVRKLKTEARPPFGIQMPGFSWPWE